MSFDLAQLKARLPGLVAASGLAADILPRASEEARTRGVGFCAAMISLGVDESMVLAIMSAGTGLPLLDALPSVDPGIGAGFDEARCRAMQVVPISREGGTLIVACVDPLIETSPDAKAMPPHRLVLTSRALLDSALERVFGVPTDPASHKVAPVGRTSPLIKALGDSLPQVIGGFQRLSRLGEGGMASVFRAQELSTGRTVALKVMLPHLARDKDFVARFLQEATAAKRLSHPHVVAVYGTGEEGGAPFIASELMDGGTVEELLLKTGPMPAPLALEIFAQALEGVAAAHTVGIIHRDLKPANLLLSSEGVVKVGDFGIAKVAGAAKLTQTGIVVGTPAYMSPEQAVGGQLSPASDLFAMGIILYELLSGTNPHNAESGTAAVMRVLNATVPPILKIAPSVPPELESMLHKLIVKDAAQRSASAQEWLPQVTKWLAPYRAAGQNLVKDALEHPKESSQALATSEARRLYAQARPLLTGSPMDRRRGTFMLYRASLMAPAEADIEAALREVCVADTLTFGEAVNPKIHELEASYQAAPDALGVLQQLGNLYRLEGNAWRAAFYLRQYLRARPLDGYAAGQLAQLTGESAGALASDARPPSRANLPSAAAAMKPVTKAAAAPTTPGFVEYEKDEEHRPGKLVADLWREQGRVIVIVLCAIVLLVGTVKAIDRFVDASATTPRQPKPPPTLVLPPLKLPPQPLPVDDGSSLLAAARKDLHDDNAAAALARLEEFSSRFPTHPGHDEGQVMRAEAHLALGHLPNAESDASEAIARLPPGALRLRAEKVMQSVRGVGPPPGHEPPGPHGPEPLPPPPPDTVPTEE